MTLYSAIGIGELAIGVTLVSVAIALFGSGLLMGRKDVLGGVELAPAELKKARAKAFLYAGIVSFAAFRPVSKIFSAPLPDNSRTIESVWGGMVLDAFMVFCFVGIFVLMELRRTGRERAVNAWFRGIFQR